MINQDVATRPATSLLIDFTRSGNSAHFRQAGWSAQEADGIWSLGSRSRLTVPNFARSQAVILELEVTPCVALPLVQAQLLTVRANGVAIGWQRLGAPCVLRCRLLPADVGAGDDIDLVFEHPCFIRLDRFGPGQDDRALAICFRTIRAYAESAAGETLQGAAAARKNLDLEAPVPLSTSLAAEATTYDLRGQGDNPAALIDGWHIDDEGLVWTAAPSSRLQLPSPGFDGPINLRIALAPLITQDLHPAQRLAIILDGLMVAQHQVRHETALSVPLPPEATYGRATMDIVFATPDALPMRRFAHGHPTRAMGFVIDGLTAERAPARLRMAAAIRGDGIAEPPPIATSARFLEPTGPGLHAAIEAELGITAIALMRGFESLGDNCAFGLAQRKAGAEILGLLRFANTPLRSLLRGLAEVFCATLDKSEIELYLNADGNPREYMIRIDRYGIRWHTLIHETEADADQVPANQIVKLGFLRRKFEEGLRSGRKIYTLLRSEPRKIEVVMPGWRAPRKASGGRGVTMLVPAWDSPQSYEVAPAGLSLAEALPVLFELNRSGPNTLLYFVQATADRPAGTVDLVASGLMRASMTSFVILTAGEQANDLDWIRVAANALLLHRGANARFHQKEST